MQRAGAGQAPTPKQGHGMGDGLFFERLHQEVYCGDCAEMSLKAKAENLEKIAFFYIDCRGSVAYSACCNTACESAVCHRPGVQLNLYPRGNRKVRHTKPKVPPLMCGCVCQAVPYILKPVG
jgi:hypothetical protein